MKNPPSPSWLVPATSIDNHHLARVATHCCLSETNSKHPRPTPSSPSDNPTPPHPTPLYNRDTRSHLLSAIHPCQPESLHQPHAACGTRRASRIIGLDPHLSIRRDVIALPLPLFFIRRIPGLQKSVKRHCNLLHIRRKDEVSSNVTQHVLPALETLKNNLNNTPHFCMLVVEPPHGRSIGAVDVHIPGRSNL